MTDPARSGSDRPREIRPEREETPTPRSSPPSYSRTVIGLDIGGSKIHGAAFDADLRAISHRRVANTYRDLEGLAEASAGVVAALVADVGGPVESIGIGIPGRIDPSGAVRHAVNLGVSERPFNIGRTISRRHDIPAFVENDVNAAALGAYELIKSGQDIRDLTYLSIGTGLAAGVIIDGRIHRGRRGVAGEIGHFPTGGRGPACACGLRGCLEALASGRAINRYWPDGHGRIPAAELLDAARAGNADAITVVDRLADHLARSIYLLALTYDTGCIVIGGGVSDTGPPLLDAIRGGITRLERQSRFVASLDLGRDLMLRPSPDTGVIGAAVVARRGALEAP